VVSDGCFPIELDYAVISASLETLLEAGFAPRRTIVAAFGIDEESSGKQVWMDRIAALPPSHPLLVNRVLVHWLDISKKPMALPALLCLLTKAVGMTAYCHAFLTYPLWQGGIVQDQGVLLATPEIGEKGYLGEILVYLQRLLHSFRKDVRIQISTPGGHSSVPPGTRPGSSSDVLRTHDEQFSSTH
jgi:Gly-Xaa carboxypeptidase